MSTPGKRPRRRPLITPIGIQNSSDPGSDSPATAVAEDVQILTTDSLPEEFKQHSRLLEAHQFFRRPSNKKRNLFNAEEWEVFQELMGVGVCHVQQEGRKSAKHFRLVKKINSMSWSRNSDSTARPYAWVISLLYDHYAAEHAVSIARDKWEKQSANPTPFADERMPETLSLIKCNKKPLCTQTQINQVLENDAPNPFSVTEKELKYRKQQFGKESSQLRPASAESNISKTLQSTICDKDVVHFTSTSKSWEQNAKHPLEETSLALAPVKKRTRVQELSDDATTHLDNDELPAEPTRPDPNENFFGTKYTWSQVGQACSRARTSMAAVMTWFHKDPRLYQWCHINNEAGLSMVRDRQESIQIVREWQVAQNQEEKNWMELRQQRKAGQAVIGALTIKQWTQRRLEEEKRAHRRGTADLTSFLMSWDVIPNTEKVSRKLIRLRRLETTFDSTDEESETALVDRPFSPATQKRGATTEAQRETGSRQGPDVPKAQDLINLTDTIRGIVKDEGKTTGKLLLTLAQSWNDVISEKVKIAEEKGEALRTIQTEFVRLTALDKREQQAATKLQDQVAILVKHLENDIK